jgi:hypothetical protein
MTIANYASSIVNKLEALLTDDASVVIYKHPVFIVQATQLGVKLMIVIPTIVIFFVPDKPF